MKSYTEKQKIKIIEKIDAEIATGTPIIKACKNVGISDYFYYTWSKKNNKNQPIKKRKKIFPRSETNRRDLLAQIESEIAEGALTKDACRNHKTTTSSLHLWRKKYRTKSPLKSHAYNTPPVRSASIVRSEKEISELKAVIADLYLENKLLKQNAL